jgi:hypothetical protein
MVNELSIVVMMSITAILMSVITYSVGFREGEREGYLKGRSVSRHISAKAEIK